MQSSLDILLNPNRHLDDDTKHYALVKWYSLDDLLFDTGAFGTDPQGLVNRAARVVKEAPEPFCLIDETNEKRFDKHRRMKHNKLATDFYDLLHQLWELHPVDVFPSPQRIADTLRILNTTTPQGDKTQQRTAKVQDGIDRFEAAVGIRMDSTRLFATTGHRLGIGPQ